MKKISLLITLGCILGLYQPLNAQDAENVVNGHEYVDLALPSGLKWATCNVGASKPEACGSYFAWGETKPKDEYISANSLTYGKEIDDISGNVQYDAATANWGEGWRMPTKDEMQELIDNCDWEWTKQNKVKGYKVTGVNGNSIFIPETGLWNDTFYSGGCLGSCYWSSSVPSGNSYAYNLSFSSSSHYRSNNNRYYGYSIRPVIEVVEKPTVSVSVENYTEKTAIIKTFVSSSAEITERGFYYGTNPEPAQEETIKVGDQITMSWGQPIVDYYSYSVCQQIYTAAEMQGKTGTIGRISFEHATGGTALRDIVVYMKNIAKTDFSTANDWIEVSDSDIVYSGTWSIPATFNKVINVAIDFTKGFEYTGGDVLLCIYDKTGTAMTENCNQFYCTQNAEKVNRAMFCTSESEMDMTALSSLNGTRYKFTNNIEFTFKAETDNKVVLENEVGYISNTLINLTPNTTYYVKAYATNSEGTSYSEMVSFTTLENPKEYEYVDLGLPSGLKWATHNIGATTPEEYGNYYAWGEVLTKDEYTESNSLTYGKPMDDISGTEYDAATFNWGGDWRMPTETEMEELIDNCTWTWTTQNGVSGYKVTSKTNGNSIFLPAAGYRNGASLSNAGSYGYYRSSSPYVRYFSGNAYYDNAYHLNFSSYSLSKYYTLRYYGQSVRPVLE